MIYILFDKTLGANVLVSQNLIDIINIIKERGNRENWFLEIWYEGKQLTQINCYSEIKV